MERHRVPSTFYSPSTARCLISRLAVDQGRSRAYIEPWLSIQYTAVHFTLSDIPSLVLPPQGGQGNGFTFDIHNLSVYISPMTRCYMTESWRSVLAGFSFCLNDSNPRFGSQTRLLNFPWSQSHRVSIQGCSWAPVQQPNRKSCRLRLGVGVEGDRSCQHCLRACHLTPSPSVASCAPHFRPCH